MLKEVRNADGKLVAQIDEDAHTIVIVQRGCITLLRLNSKGFFDIENKKEATA